MRIEKTEPSRKKRGQYLLLLEGGDPLEITEQELLTFDLADGRELDEETLAALRASAALSLAKAQAAALIGRRALSKRGLTRKLTEKEAAPEDAQAAADWLEEFGAVDDAAYAALLVRRCASLGYGPARYREKLYEAGISKELWEAAMAEAPDPEELIDRYLASRLRGGFPDQKEIRRTADTLARRGFGWAEIRSALRRYGEGEDLDKREDNGL